MKNNQAQDDFLSNAKALVSSIETGDEQRSIELLNQLGAKREFSLFDEIGKLTRQLHQAISTFQVDLDQISNLTTHDMPDAKDRLQHVITMTENAANRTMDSVEKVLPLVKIFEDETESLTASWSRFLAKDMQADEFRALCQTLTGYFANIKQNSAVIHANLTEVMVAQDFQDLTGQIIRRVISLVQEVESNLVRMIKLSGSTQLLQPLVEVKLSPKEIAAEGPQIHANTRKDVVDSQDDVDDLLSSLGF